MHSSPSSSYAPPEDFSFHVGVLASVIVHLIALFVFTMPTKEAFKPNEVFEVTIEAPQETPKQLLERKNQLVSPSEEQPSAPPKETSLQSDQDNSVLKEQVKRGTENSAPALGTKGAGKQAPAMKSETQKAQPEKKEVKAPSQEPPRTKPLTDLKLDSDTLIKEFAMSAPEKNKPQDSAKNQRFSQASYRAFSRPMGSGAMFIGLSGSSDHLPNLPDGDITLLNTKANKFAVFVRRVATQVFAQIRAQGWDYLSPSDIDAISGYSTVRAVLSPKGQLLKVVLESTSRSSKFDEVILGAARKGASDPNPPKDAVASDGNVHFIFQAKSWVDIVPAPRSGIPTQRRWLLLSTGLD